MTKRARSIGIWAGLIGSALVLATLATGLIHREQRRQAEADRSLLASETARLTARLAGYLQEIQSETARQLIAFHEEGLENQLRRWRNANALVSETRTLPPGPESDRYFADATTLVSLDNAETPSELRGGFYEENRQLAAYENRAVDPVLSWSVSSNSGMQTWSVAHRIGPQTKTRVAELDRETLRQAFADFVSEFAGPGLEARIVFGPTTPSADVTQPLADLLPGAYLALDLSAAASETAWLTHFGYAMVAICLALGIVCAALLSRQAERERREALRKTTFVSQISHEFKTPLTSIGLYADLLAADDLPPSKRTRYLDTIGRESQRLTDLVDNLLALSALEQGKKTYRIVAVDLVSTVTQLVADYAPVLSKANMEIRWQPAMETAPALIDIAALRQAVINILDNARKYASFGGFAQIELSRGQAGWELAISDRGPGIPPRFQERIFESFFQEKALLANKSPGAGLGLSISRRLLRDCHGDLSLDSRYANGARFVLTIPASDSSSAPSTTQS